MMFPLFVELRWDLTGLFILVLLILLLFLNTHPAGLILCVVLLSDLFIPLSFKEYSSIINKER